MINHTEQLKQLEIIFIYNPNVMGEVQYNTSLNLINSTAIVNVSTECEF